jgi:hypothetical protein
VNRALECGAQRDLFGPGALQGTVGHLQLARTQFAHGPDHGTRHVAYFFLHVGVECACPFLIVGAMTAI